MLQTKNARADHNFAIKQFSAEERKRRQLDIRRLVGCHRAWKLQDSAPFEYMGRTFDMIPGSLPLCDALFEALYGCLTGLVDGVAAKLDEIDAAEERWRLVAELEQCMYGTLQSSTRDGVDRPEHAKDGWRHGSKRRFEVAGLAFDPVLEPLAWGTRALTGEDRTVALYEVLRSALLSGATLESTDAVYKAADVFAIEIARRRGAR